jgi:NAD(P)-dependent dehydrogenase (short-subunit alcohol dehydrogenase family)
MGKLAGKVAIVTGASRGIGKEISLLFGREGAKVVCAARTLREGEHKIYPGSLESTVAAIQAAGGQAIAVITDLSKELDCERLVQTAKETYGACDVLVNNAAYAHYSPIVGYPSSRRLSTFAVTFHAPFVLSQLVLDYMISQRSGAIINISSSTAVGPGRGPYNPDVRVRHDMTLYGSEKAALERFTQGLAQEVYEYGITVACLAPSEVVLSPFAAMVSGRGVSDEGTEPPESMARAALLLATEPLDKVTGRVTYSQRILKEYGLIEVARGPGVDQPGTGYSER